MNLLTLRVLLRDLSRRRRHLIKLAGIISGIILTDTREHRRLSIEHHLAMLADTVPRGGRDLVPVLELVLLLRRPGEIVTTDFDVVVGELAELVVVHAEEFGFLRGAQVQTRDHVDGEGDDGGHHEGVRAGGGDVGDLDVHLFPVVDDPAAGGGAGVDPVQAEDGVVAKQGVEEESDDSCDAVFGEDIHGVVDADPVFD